jgi:hypothetical protein
LEESSGGVVVDAMDGWDGNEDDVPLVGRHWQSNAPSDADL